MATPTRVAVVATVMRTDGWFDAEELLNRVREEHTRLSRATVYRLLPRLCNSGLLHMSEFGDGRHRYRRADPGENPSAEIYIIDCGRIIEREAPFLTWYGRTLVGRAGLELESQRLQVHARCSHKRQGGSCELCPHEATALPHPHTSRVGAVRRSG
ncbi:MAG: transcriptional repressor [Opitutaceae bacterium]|nr:transcriptional repressor [Opitutaceae bacterium]